MKFENKKVIYSAPLPSWAKEFATKKASEICKRKGFSVNTFLLDKESTHLWFCPKALSEYWTWNFNRAGSDGHNIYGIATIDVAIGEFFDCLENYEPSEEVTIAATNFIGRKAWDNFKLNGEFRITFCGKDSVAKNKDFLKCLAELIDIFPVRAGYHSYGSIALYSNGWAGDPNRNFETFIKFGLKHGGEAGVFMKSDNDDGIYYILDSKDGGMNWSIKRIIPVG